MPNHDERFREFHEKNPEVYQELVSLARQAVARGRRKMGIKMLFEVVRWQRFLRTTDPDSGSTYKLNNNYHSRYARLIMDQESDLRGIFEVRELKTGGDSEDPDDFDGPSLLDDYA